MTRKVKVAVVGSGLAGLSAAHFLSQSPSSDEVEFEVHLFEKSDTLGMDAYSVSLPIPNSDTQWRVDVPMRSFQGGYYPQLISMYKQLGVKFRKRDFSYSFSLLSWPRTNSTSIREPRTITTTMIYNGASGRAGVGMPSMLSNGLGKKGDTFWFRWTETAVTYGVFALLTLALVFNYARLIFLSLPFTRNTRTSEMSFLEWSRETVPRGFLARWLGMDASWEEFTRHVLVPLFSAVCTASEKDVLDHPVEEFLDYTWLTFGTHHYVVTNGVREIVNILSRGIHHVYTASPISEISLNVTNPRLISLQCTTSDGASVVHSGFSHIILATQANHASAILSSYCTSLRHSSPQRRYIASLIQCLDTFTYKPTVVVNHTDESLMPDNQSDRRDLNLVAADDSRPSLEDSSSKLCVDYTYAMATHVLPRPPSYPHDSPTVYQTTNPIIPPRDGTLLSVARLERAVLTREAKKALQGLCMERERRWWQCSVQANCQLGWLQGAGRLDPEVGSTMPAIWVCGSYAHTGIPLLEGCLASARNIVEQGVFLCEGVPCERSS
ncbi:hypothetical protein JAAARDRAFT_209119 [Jaapia argillacea MUCL 33604]|uniref:Amine oxidase domain-containing protein n=1 Tax=Jaapia argillacea MUCL 33604 TaxID=933084 RepID=A0A067PX79_9AGAM|nr:hypothetical protein JAAARDRAFT_209119 [Jaapia argillacea MUCL 33604]